MLTSLYLAIVVYAPSLALSQVTGLNVDLAILITFAVCIFYTSLGGIKAVIWTNVFQVCDIDKPESQVLLEGLISKACSYRLQV